MNNSSLSEETFEVQMEIENLWKEAGHQYYLENQNELQKLNMIDSTPENYPDYIKRPTIGCRALVRRSLQVLNSILHEMEDWKEDVRLHSTKLLTQIVIHSEDHLAIKYFDINAVLCKTCDDQEASVARQAIETAKLVGRFVDATTWTKFIFEELKIRQNKLGILKCMNALYRNSSSKNRFANIFELSEILLDNSICHNTKESFQLQLMELLEILIVDNPEQDEKLVRNFYIATLKSTAVSFDNETVRTAGMEVMDQLVKRCTSATTTSEMHATYLNKALETLDLLDKADSDSFEQVTILYGIICLCGFEVSNQHLRTSDEISLHSIFSIILKEIVHR